VDQFAEFLRQRFTRYSITDQVLFGDLRPLHRQAVASAARHGVRTHVFEEGYFRPHWVTLERDGVNVRSRLPRDPDWFRAVGARLPDAGAAEPFAAPFRVRAWHDVIYHCASALNPLLFPGYRTHALVTAPVEYLGYARRFAHLARTERRELRRAEQIARGSAPYYVLPLQLNGDAQIREHSPHGDMLQVIAAVMQSFAGHAPAAARLVIKNHPLDMALVDYAGAIAGLERQFDLGGRVEYLEAGDLGLLVARAAGVVTVNSTAGTVALAAGCPTIALGAAIYDLPGLTFEAGLDEFWRRAQSPDPQLFRYFRNTVIHATQVHGGFYSRAGIELAARNAAPPLTAERSPLEELL
jgi:capsular polysaccharide export protein